MYGGQSYGTIPYGGLSQTGVAAATVPDAPDLANVVEGNASLSCDVVTVDDGGSAITAKGVQLTGPAGSLFPTPVFSYDTWEDTSLTDSVGTAPDIEADGQYEAGLVGDGLSGGSDVVGSASPGLTLASAQTQSAWVFIAAGTGGANQVVDDGTNRAELYAIAIASVWEISYGGLSATPAAANGWNLISVTRAVGGSSKLYLNGVQVGSTGSSTLSATAGAVVNIIADSKTCQFTGWQSVLTAAQLLKWYNAGIGRLATDRNLVAIDSSSPASTETLTWTTDANGVALANGTEYDFAAWEENAVGRSALSTESSGTPEGAGGGGATEENGYSYGYHY